jgi:uncharacterized membrane protein
VTFLYDPATAVGQVRLLCTDTDQARPIFEDEEIEAFLGMFDQQPMLAAAQALETIAANEALVEKVISVLGVSIDGAKLCRELRRNAEAMRKTYVAYCDDPAFDTAEFADDFLQAHELRLKNWLREGS